VPVESLPREFRLPSVNDDIYCGDKMGQFAAYSLVIWISLNSSFHSIISVGEIIDDGSRILCNKRKRQMNIESENITAVAHRVSVQERWRSNGLKGGLIWFAGLSGSEKTTLAFELEQLLFDTG
jgi:hypothetical protein